MKKFILSAIAVISFTIASQAQFKVGIKAGAGLSNQRINVTEGSIYSSDHFKGYHAGVISELHLGGNFYLQPQFLFSQKGVTLLNSNGHDAQLKMSYLEAPVNVLYKFNLPCGKIFLGAGGAFSYAVAGNQTIDGHKTNLYSNNNDWKREDISLTFTAGFEFNNGLFASINSQKGLLNTSRASGVSSKNESLSASVGYLIDWKKLKRKA